MINYQTKKYLLDNGFEEIHPWSEYKHNNGLFICISDHEWSIKDVSDIWKERGSLGNLSLMYDIIEDYENR